LEVGVYEDMKKKFVFPDEATFHIPGIVNRPMSVVLLHSMNTCGVRKVMTNQTFFLPQRK